MAWFFVQVWVLCVIAFLLGSAATWLAFVRPLRRARRPDDAGWPVLSAAWPARSAVGAPGPLPVPSGEATDPALSALDVRGRARRAATGRAATDALDRLGIGSSIPAQATGPGQVGERPDIPAQPGPADTAGR